MKLCTAWIIRHSSKTIFAKHVERYKVSKFCPGKGVIYPFPIKILYDNYACWFSTRLTVTITHKQMLWFPVNFTISMRILHHKINTHWIDMLFRRIVTFLIFAPYKYSYLLTYLLTCIIIGLHITDYVRHTVYVNHLVMFVPVCVTTQYENE